VFSWRLGGIVYESSSLFLKASRADCLNPDGTISRYPNPMAYQKKGSGARIEELRPPDYSCDTSFLSLPFLV
jgi:hypothetical protein